MSKQFITGTPKLYKNGWRIPKHYPNHEADLDQVMYDDDGEVILVEGSNHQMARRKLHVLKTAEGVLIDGRKVESPDLTSFFYSYFQKAKVTFVDGGSMWMGSSNLKRIAYMETREDELPCQMCKTTGVVDDDICPTCGGPGYMVTTIRTKDGASTGWLCTECAKEGRSRSFKIRTGTSFAKVTAMRPVYEGDDLTYEDYQTEAPYAHFHCAWGHEFTDGY